jgi:hypothetical protein
MLNRTFRDRMRHPLTFPSLRDGPLPLPLWGEGKESTAHALSPCARGTG